MAAVHYDLWTRIFVAFVFPVVAALYVVNVFATLRLNTDSITLLGSAISELEGHGRLFEGHPTVFPLGFPILIETLMRAGVASTPTLVTLNLVFLLLVFWHSFCYVVYVSVRSRK